MSNNEKYVCSNSCRCVCIGENKTLRKENERLRNQLMTDDVWIGMLNDRIDNVIVRKEAEIVETHVEIVRLQSEIERLRELLVRCVPLIPQHWELGPNGKMTAKELEKEVSDER